jgi:hypothetical protein
MSIAAESDAATPPDTPSCCSPSIPDEDFHGQKPFFSFEEKYFFLIS